MNKFIKFFNKFKHSNNHFEVLHSELSSMFEKLKVLVTYNILDLSIIKEIITFVININSSGNNISNNHNHDGISELFKLFRKEIKRVFRELKHKLTNELNLTVYYQILNFTIFWNILIISMKNANHESNTINILFYEIFFEKNCYFMNMLKKIIIQTQHFESQTELLKLISNVFSEFGELKQIMYNYFESKIKLEDLFYYNQKYFKKVIPEMEDYRQSSPNQISNSIYCKLLENIHKIEFNYNSMFYNKNNNMNGFCLNEDKSLIKSMFCQAILRIVFSKEKNKFLNENVQYEISFLKNVTKECVTYYYDKFGDNINCLFRREEIYDDLIKFLFFTNGNNLYYRSYYLNLKKIIDKYSHDDSENEASYLSTSEFLVFFKEVIIQMKTYMPNKLKIVLKLLYENVVEIYKVEPGNYSPVLTIVFFNFFISPRIQEIYNISPIKNSMVKNLNRLIRNICFNEKFKQDDPMNNFNHVIESCSMHINLTIEKIINSFFVDDMDYIMKLEIETDYKTISTPSYLFYFDCEYVLNVLEFSMNQNILEDIDKEVDYIEKTMLSKKNSFYIKINLEDFKKLKILELAIDKENGKEESEDEEDENEIEDEHIGNKVIKENNLETEINQGNNISSNTKK